MINTTTVSGEPGQAPNAPSRDQNRTPHGGERDHKLTADETLNLLKNPTDNWPDRGLRLAHDT
jgi:hypothetical protein